MRRILNFNSQNLVSCPYEISISPRALWDSLSPGALVEFVHEDSGRPLVGKARGVELLELGACWGSLVFGGLLQSLQRKYH